MENTYRLSVNIGEGAFSVESNDKDWVELKQGELAEYIKEHLGAIDRDSGRKSVSRGVSVGGSSITIQEFYKKYVQPSNKLSRPDLAVLLIYYLEKINGETEIKTGDVTNAFGSIGYPGYNKINFSDVLLNARKKGFLNYVNSNWTLTLTGEDFVVDRISAAE